MNLMKTRRKNAVRGTRREHYILALYERDHLLRSIAVSELGIAGKMFVNPRMIISEEKIKRADQIVLIQRTPLKREWTRDPQKPAWFVGINDGSCVHELDQDLVSDTLDVIIRQLMQWFPDLDMWRASAMATHFSNNAAIGLGRFEVLELVEVDPRQAEIEALALEQETDNEGS